MQRHATQMEALRRQCDQDEKMLLEKHQKATRAKSWAEWQTLLPTFRL